MRLTFVWVGQTKNSHLAELEREYLQRIGHYARCQVDVVRDVKGGSSPTAAEKIRQSEGEAILRTIPDRAYVVLLDERGKELRSEEMAQLIARNKNTATKVLTFVVGGPHGTSDSLWRRADLRVSLSRLTLTHEISRLILVEQIYRAFAIIRGLPYPK